MMLLWSTSVAKDSNIVPSLFFSHYIYIYIGPSPFLFPFFIWAFFYLAFLFLAFLFFYWDNALLNDDHHTSIYLQLNDYNSILEQSMTLYECLRRCTGMCNDSWVTCMKELWTVVLPQILCQLHDHAKQYDNDECVMINGWKVAWQYISEWLWKCHNR